MRLPKLLPYKDDIEKLLKEGKFKTEIAKLYNVTPMTVANFVKKHIDNVPPEASTTKLTQTYKCFQGGSDWLYYRIDRKHPFYKQFSLELLDLKTVDNFFSSSLTRKQFLEHGFITPENEEKLMAGIFQPTMKIMIADKLQDNPVLAKAMKKVTDIAMSNYSEAIVKSRFLKDRGVTKEQVDSKIAMYKKDGGLGGILESGEVRDVLLLEMQENIKGMEDSLESGYLSEEVIENVVDDDSRQKLSRTRAKVERSLFDLRAIMFKLHGERSLSIDKDSQKIDAVESGKDFVSNEGKQLTVGTININLGEDVKNRDIPIDTELDDGDIEEGEYESD